MYHAHFGFEKNLFDGGIAEETAVFMGPRQQAIAANLGIALTTLDSVVVLTGPAGVGKTTLTAAALRMTHTRVALGWLPSTPTSSAELLETLLAEFGFSAHRVGRVERLQMWRQFLNEMNATDTRVFVIAERADALDVDMLRALESVTAADPNGCPGTNVILLGHSELTERLKAPALASLRQRVRLRQTLEPFSTAELEAYLKRRVAAANGVFDKVFEADAVASLHRYTGGIPRAVNNLCETALTLAASSNEQRVTAQLVRKIAVDLFGVEDPDTAPSIAAAQQPEPAPMAAAARSPEPRAPADEFPVLTDAVETPAPPPEVPEVAAASSTPEPVPAAAAPAPHAPAAPAPAVPAPAAAAPAPHAPAAAAAAGPAPAPPATPALAQAFGTPPATGMAAAVARAAAAILTPRPAQAAPRAIVAPPPTPASVAPAHAAAPIPAKPATPAKPVATAAAAPAADGGDNEAQQTQTLRALASAESIDDMSATMAETLFGDSDLDMLSAALASAGWSDDEDAEELLDELARTSADESATMETPNAAYANFGRQRETELSLLEDTEPGDAGLATQATAKR